MVSHMKDEYKIKWEEAERELQEIKQWIDSGRNKFDSKTRYLISYAVIKASGCLLYTSDAADEEDSVELCGRRVNKKKTK